MQAISLTSLTNQNTKLTSISFGLVVRLYRLVHYNGHTGEIKVLQDYGDILYIHLSTTYKCSTVTSMLKQHRDTKKRHKHLLARASESHRAEEISKVCVSDDLLSRY